MRYYWNAPSENSDIKHTKNKREVKPYGTGQSFHWTLLLRSQFSADVTPISELHLPGEVRHRERTHARDVHYTYINGSKFKSQVSLSLNKVQNKSTCTIPTFDQKLCYKCSEFCFFFFFWPAPHSHHLISLSLEQIEKDEADDSITNLPFQVSLCNKFAQRMLPAHPKPTTTDFEV